MVVAHLADVDLHIHDGCDEYSWCWLFKQSSEQSVDWYNGLFLH